VTSPVNANNIERLSAEAYMGRRVGSGFIQSSFNMTCLSYLSPRRCLCLECPLPEEPMPPSQHTRWQTKSFASGNHHLAATIADRAANSKKISNFCRGPASASREASQEHLPLRWSSAASISQPDSNGNVTLRSYGIPGHSYDVQRSTDLLTWTTISGATGVTAAANALILYTDNPGSGTAFYRFAVRPAP
jgi:hypothetical protein